LRTSSELEARLAFSIRPQYLAVFLGFFAAALAGCGGTAVAAKAAATTPAALTATLQPATATVAVGASATFTADLSATAPAGLQWTASGGSLAAATTAGAQSSDVYTAGSTPGTYTISLGEGGANGPLATATVIVTAAAAPPAALTAELQPATATLSEGASAAFTANLSAAAPAGLQWTAGGGSFAAQAAAGTQAGGTYTAGTTPGSFTLSLTEADGTPLATAAITITSPPPPPPAPAATLQPASLSLAAGANATITATVTGTDPASLAWSATGGTIAAAAATGSTVSATYTAGTAPGTFQIAVAASAGGTPLATAGVTIAPAARLFPAAAADWLYTAPTGSGLNISSIAAGMSFTVDTHAGGFDYPVVTTDGSHGCTTFTDTLQYANTDRICVPNPAQGYYPSVGGYGANDGHLVVIDTANGNYYDFWKLYTTNGVPNSTNVGAIKQGSLSGNGTPGTTAAEITGAAGDIMPGELDCATCLNHALLVVVPGSMNSNQLGTQAPVTHTDGTVSGAVFREGAKIQFEPSIDVANLSASTATKAILRALQLYGGVICDQSGGNGFAFYSDLATNPDLTGLNQAGSHLLLYY
jgi:hypothetical protein